MAGYAGSTTGIVHADMTLTRSTVKVKVTGRLNFQQLAKPCMLAAMTVSPLAGLSRLGRRLSMTYSRLELRCVRPSVRTKSFFPDFHLIWCVGRPRPHMRTSVTSTRSKVRVKVTELRKLRKLHFSRYISSVVSAWRSKLMVVDDCVGPGLQRAGAQFLNFLLEKLSRVFKPRRMSTFNDIQVTIFR